MTPQTIIATIWAGGLTFTLGMCAGAIFGAKAGKPSWTDVIACLIWPIIFVLVALYLAKAGLQVLWQKVRG